MRKMKKFAAIMLLTAVASLVTPQAFAGAVEMPGLATNGAVEMPGLEANGAVEMPGLTAALTFLAGFLG